MRKISQAEARRLKNRVEELEQREQKLFNHFSLSHPGIWLGARTLEPDWFRGRLEAARMLGCVVCVTLDKATANFHAVKRPA